MTEQTRDAARDIPGKFDPMPGQEVDALRAWLSGWPEDAPVPRPHWSVVAPKVGRLIARVDESDGRIRALEAEVAALRARLNTPETADFVEAVKLEAAHQVERWGEAHDRNKTPADWFWLVGYLAGKALSAHTGGDVTKALHHTISTAGALSQWHRHILAGGHDPAKSNDLERSVGVLPTPPAPEGETP